MAVIHCLTRGGDPVAVSTSGVVLANPVTGINLGGCANYKIPNSSENALYYFTCEKTSPGSQIDWPTGYGHYGHGPEFLLADLGASVLATTTTTVPFTLPSIFTYELESSPSGITAAADTVNPVATQVKVVDNEDATKIVAISISLNVRYKTGKSNFTDLYRFSQTILLRGSNKALEESYNGQ